MYVVVQTKDDRFVHSYGSEWSESSEFLKVRDPEVDGDIDYPIEDVRWWQQVEPQRGYLGDIHYPEGTEPSSGDKELDELIERANDRKGTQ